MIHSVASLLSRPPLHYSCRHTRWRTAQQDQPLAGAAAGDTAPIPADQLDSLVAPVAHYPDPLLAQTLAASTYPLEVMQLQQWMPNNSYLKDQALADAVEKQPWDPSVQAMATFPDVVKLLSDNVAWVPNVPPVAAALHEISTNGDDDIQCWPRPESFTKRIWGRYAVVGTKFLLRLGPAG